MRRVGASRSVPIDKAWADVEEDLKRAFRPEFLNRIDEVILFSSLSREQIQEIVNLQMSEITERLREQNITIELTDAARDYLANIGFDPQFGATSPAPHLTAPRRIAPVAETVGK